MRKTLLLALLALLGMTQAVAQEYEYVPFVREGVKWVYYYENYDGIRPADSDLNNGTVYLTLEIKGDTVINGKSYKAMHKYHGSAINRENDTIPIYLREENQVVYGFVLDGKTFADCPIGNAYDPHISQNVLEGREFVVYDFKDPESYWDTHIHEVLYPMHYYDPLYMDTVSVGNHFAKRYVGKRFYSREFHIIEGIGIDTYGSSYTLFPFMPSSIGMDPIFHFSHLIEDGKIVYKSLNYKETEPEDYQYVPFVREGVKWVYYYSHIIWNEDFNENYLPYGTHQMTMEIKGDTIINGKSFKPVHIYSGKSIDEKHDTIACYVREEHKVVYVMLRDRRYWACPVGIGQLVEYPMYMDWIVNFGKEYVLYDFNDPAGFYGDLNDYGQLFDLTYANSDFLNISGHLSKRHNFYFADKNHHIIEGIGYDGDYPGIPTCYFYGLITGFTQIYYSLSHVIEDGKIIYKAYHYDGSEVDGIDEAVADRTERPADPHYYDLTGRSVGTEVPTAPGIYIHQGKKICVGRMP